MASPAVAAAAVPRGVAMLRALQPPVPFEVRPYAYVEKGGTSASSSALGINEHAIIKTLLFQESEDAPPLVLLQHGDASVDTKRLIKELARTRGMHSGRDGAAAAAAASSASAPAAAAAASASDSKKSKPRAFLCPTDTAERFSGFQVGGCSPFGLRDPTLRIFMESSLLDLDPEKDIDAAVALMKEGKETRTAVPREAEHVELHRREVDEWISRSAASALRGSATALAAPSPQSLDLALVTPAWAAINGGARGTLVALSVRSIVDILRPIIISVGKPAKAAAAAPAESATAAATGAGVKAAE